MAVFDDKHARSSTPYQPRSTNSMFGNSVSALLAERGGRELKNGEMAGAGEVLYKLESNGDTRSFALPEAYDGGLLIALIATLQNETGRPWTHPRSSSR